MKKAPAGACMKHAPRPGAFESTRRFSTYSSASPLQRADAFVFQSFQFHSGNHPFLVLAPAARPLVGLNAAEAAPFTHRIFGLAQHDRYLAGRVPVLYGLP